jgi:phage baseplate assembly protein W
MITAIIETLEVAGTSSTSKLVTFGVSIVETDASLASRWVSGVIVWGDGSPNTEIPPEAERIDDPSTPAITRDSNVCTLALDPKPYTGQFILAYGGNPIAPLGYDVTSYELLQALQSEIGDDGFGNQLIESVAGESPVWAIRCRNPATASSLTVDSGHTTRTLRRLQAHSYPQGNFTAKLESRNYRSPNPDTAVKTIGVFLAEASSMAKKTPILIGPVLPADVGYPNKDQWSLNSAEDLKCLASNVKMILITKLGERLMMPDYGCDVTRYLFDPNDQHSEADIQAEITRAINRWEPRVALEKMSLKREDTSATVTMTLVSKLSRQRFQFNVELER